MGKLLKPLSVFLTVLLLSAAVFGCGTQKDNNSGATPEPEKKVEEGLTLPLKKPVSIKAWMILTAKVRAIAPSFGETEIAKELEKRTGVKVEYIHPLEGQEKEQFNLMIAARDLPDIFIGGLGYYGIQKAFNEGIVVELNELQTKYGPNLTKLYKQYPEILPNTATEDGKIYATPVIKADVKMTEGPMLRKDWLNELGMKVPTTIDEWYTVLKAFKEKKNAKAPLTGTPAQLNNNSLVGAFGIINTDFVEKGKYVYGAADLRFKDYLATMAKWYKEGLIDQEFATLNAKLIDAKMTNGQAGAMIGLSGGNMQTYLNTLYGKGTPYDMVGAPYPALKAGEPAKFLNTIQNINPVGFITSASKYPKECMAWLDYGYGKEGMMLNNYGIEGASYEMKEGKPTRLNEKNVRADGVNMMPNFVRAGVDNGPFMNIFENIPMHKQQTEASAAWGKYTKEANAANTTYRGLFTDEEAAKLKSIESELNTYKSEFRMKVIMGQESLDKFDSYVAQMKKLGLDEFIQIKQKGYDKFAKAFPEALKPSNSNWEDFYK